MDQFGRFRAGARPEIVFFYEQSSHASRGSIKQHSHSVATPANDEDVILRVGLYFSEMLLSRFECGGFWLGVVLGLVAGEGEGEEGGGGGR